MASKPSDDQPPTPQQLVARLPHWTVWHRLGRIERRVWRALVINAGKPVSSGTLAAAAYPRQAWPTIRQYGVIRAAARRFAVEVGRCKARDRRGTSILWMLRPELAENPWGDRPPRPRGLRPKPSGD